MRKRIIFMENSEYRDGNVIEKARRFSDYRMNKLMQGVEDLFKSGVGIEKYKIKLKDLLQDWYNHVVLDYLSVSPKIQKMYADEITNGVQVRVGEKVLHKDERSVYFRDELTKTHKEFRNKYVKCAESNAVKTNEEAQLMVA